MGKKAKARNGGLSKDITAPSTVRLQDKGILEMRDEGMFLIIMYSLNYTIINYTIN